MVPIVTTVAMHVHLYFYKEFGDYVTERQEVI